MTVTVLWAVCRVPVNSILESEGPEIKEKIMDFNREYYRKYYFENKEFPKLDPESGTRPLALSVCGGCGCVPVHGCVLV